MEQGRPVSLFFISITNNHGDHELPEGLIDLAFIDVEGDAGFVVETRLEQLKWVGVGSASDRQEGLGGLCEFRAPGQCSFGFGAFQIEYCVLPCYFALHDPKFIAFAGAHDCVGFEASELLFDVFAAVLWVGSGLIDFSQ